jgi:iron(III) transport system substrate-binding protein
MVVLPPADGLTIRRQQGGMSRKASKSRDTNWPKDEFGRGELWFQFWWVALLLLGAMPIIWAFARNRPSAKSRSDVVVYCAQDQLYAEPIFRDLEKSTGIKVRAVFDSEAVKTVGLANRLLAEKSYPQCDVFWANEEMRARQLAQKGVFRETNSWAKFGYRSRRMVINTNLVSLSAVPQSLLELTNQQWRGKIALAYPQFGSTATHFHALRQYWGAAEWEKWCRALAANKPLLVDGNSVVVRLVGHGEAQAGLTDSDDIAAGQREGLPVAALPTTAETLLMPNVVAIVRGAPHPDSAQRLFDALQRPAVLERLVAGKALEGASGAGLEATSLKVDWDALLRDLASTTAKLNEIFLR